MNRHIELTTEPPITLAQAARTLPGGAVHISTLHRWRTKGIRGIRLKTFRRGGGRYTYPSWLEDFFAATTCATDGERPPTRTSKQRERDIRQAEADCERDGI